MIMLAAALLTASDPVPPSHLGEIRMHLFHTADGALSADISPPHAFAGWNTVIGEGDSGGPADDMMVVAEVITEGQQFVNRPLRIVARNRRGHVLGQRSVTAILTAHNGRAYFPLWLPDVTCTGDVRVTVTFGSEVRNETLQLNCGE